MNIGRVTKIFVVVTIAVLLVFTIPRAYAPVAIMHLGFKGVVVSPPQYNATIDAYVFKIRAFEERDFSSYPENQVCAVDWESGSLMSLTEEIVTIYVSTDKYYLVSGLNVGDYVEVRTKTYIYPEILGGWIIHWLLCIKISPQQFAKIWVDKGCGATYSVGEKCIIYFQVTRRAYVKIVDELPGGTYKVLTAGWAEPGVIYVIRGIVGEPAGYRIFHIYATDETGATSYDMCHIRVLGKTISITIRPVGIPAGFCTKIYINGVYKGQVCGGDEAHIEVTIVDTSCVLEVDEIIVVSTGVRYRALQHRFTLTGSASINIMYVKEVKVKIDAEPRVCKVIVNGIEHPVPYEDWLMVGSNTISVPEIVEYHGSYYVFAGWSDGSTEASRTIDISAPLELKAFYKKAYKLTISAKLINNAPVTVPVLINETEYSTKVSEILTEGTYLVKVEPVVLVEEGVRYSFVKWEDGVIKTERVIKLSSDTELSAVYKLQYFVNIVVKPSDYEKYLEGVFTGEGWHDENSKIMISVTKLAVEIGAGTRIIFSSWKGDILSEATSVEVTVTKPMTIVSVWKKQHYLEVISEHGSPTGEGWYDEGTQATVKVNPVEGFLVEYHFVKWILDEGTPNEKAYTSPEVVITMDKPHTLKAVWRVDYTKLIIVIVAVIGGLAAVIVVLLMIVKKKHALKHALPPPPPPSQSPY
ncbi:MAG TPA: hypothetical protein ENF55_03175 [Thermoprotei archaeon]|nr:hypothetical protein [Thermoprotei archaeon]